MAGRCIVAVTVKNSLTGPINNWRDGRIITYGMLIPFDVRINSGLFV